VKIRHCPRNSEPISELRFRISDFSIRIPNSAIRNREVWNFAASAGIKTILRVGRRGIS